MLMLIKKDCYFFETVNDMGALIKWCGHPNRESNYLSEGDCSDCRSYMHHADAKKIICDVVINAAKEWKKNAKEKKNLAKEWKKAIKESIE